MIIYKCPKCGAEVNVSYIMTNPPTLCYKCTKCDYLKDILSYPTEDEIQLAPL